MQQLRQPLLMNRTSEYRRRACLDETHNPAEQVNEGEGTEMGKVIAKASMSLDGFIADTNDQVGPLFDWYYNGDVEVTGADPGLVFHTSPASADYLRAAWSTIGADVISRRPTGPTQTRRSPSSPTACTAR